MSRRRVLSQDERVLWSTVTRAIAPLRTPLVAEEAQADVAPPLPPAPAKPAAKPMPVPAGKPAAPPLVPLGRRLRARVSRGKEAIEARLDLHGLTQTNAHATLLHFLRSAQVNGARLVLVITGKGQRGDGERGVLKRQVPQWLGLPEFRTLIVGFEDAGTRHGGEGALYVRLRRLRSGPED